MNENLDTASRGSISPDGPSAEATPAVSMSRRTFLGTAGLSAAAVGLAACSSSSSGATASGGGSAGKKATIQMGSWYTEAQPVWPSVTAEFHSAHPNIQVVPRTFSFAEYSPAIE